MGFGSNVITALATQINAAACAIVTADTLSRVSNKATFSFIFKHNMTSAAARRERKQQIFLTLMARLDGQLDDIPTGF